MIFAVVSRLRGILALALVAPLVLVGCVDPDTDENGADQRGALTAPQPTPTPAYTRLVLPHVERLIGYQVARSRR